MPEVRLNEIILFIDLKCIKPDKTNPDDTFVTLDA